MRKLFFTLAILMLAALPAAATDVRWETSLDAARQRAAREHKPILLLQMFGHLDQQLC